MDADRPPPDPEDVSDSGTGDTPEPAAESVAPAVVAVVVAAGEALHLEACVGALAASDYPDLTVLVIAQTEADLAARVASVMPTAFVRSVDVRGFAAGANDAIATVAGAPFLLFCHSDVVPEPGAVRMLVEEAYRSNAAIIGPKLVDVERPEILREVGWSIDRFGVPHSEIERDELDQEQHDAVRDVFFVSDACVLIRADLFSELGGFDPECDPGARSLDLCWRARLAAARVIVAPDARVGHFEADGPLELDKKLAQRHHVRALLTNTAAVRLLWIAPVALVLHFAEALVFLVRRRRDRAGALVGGWTGNLRDLGSLRRARARSQAGRVVSDREIHALQFRGSARISNYMTGSLRTDVRMRALTRRSRSVADSASSQFRSWRGLTMLAVVVLALVGTRGVLFGRLAAVGHFAPWPGVGDLVRSFTSEWRYAGLGTEAPAPPLLALVALLRAFGLGSGDVIRTLLVVAAIPAGALAAARAARPLVGPGWPSATTALVYAIVPIARNATARGEMGPLALYVGAPLVVLALFQVGGLVESRWPRRRIAVLGALGVATMSAFWPLAIALPLVIGLGVIAVAPITRDGFAGLVALSRASLVMVGLALLALFPWPLAFLAGGDRAGALGIVYQPVSSFGSLVRLAIGPNGAGLGSWAFVVVGLAVTIMASGPRGIWCVRLWGIIIVSWALAALPSWLGAASPEVDGLLVPAAFALSLIAGIGVAAFVEDVQRGGLGWGHALAAVSLASLALATFTYVGDTAGGRWHQPSSDWNSTLSWMHAQRDRGPFRVLWVGTPAAVPGALHRAGSTVFALTNDGPGDLRDGLAPPGGDGVAAAHAAVDQLRNDRTTRFGRLVAPMAVRYIAVPSRPSPGPTSAAEARGPLAPALAHQLDLRQLEVAPGMTLYENAAWVPGRAVLVDPPAARPTGETALRQRAPRATAARDAVVWSQGYSGDWQVGSRRGAAVQHTSVFGWANAFAPARSVVASEPITFARQWWRWVALLIELVIVGALLRRAARRGRRGRGRGHTGTDAGTAGAAPSLESTT